MKQWGKQVILCLTLAGLSGMVGAKTIVPAPKAFLKEVQEDLWRFLDHADSARFRQVVIVEEDNGVKRFCGEVDFKDDSGKYVGYVPFTGMIANHWEGKGLNGKEFAHVMYVDEGAAELCEKEVGVKLDRAG